MRTSSANHRCWARRQVANVVMNRRRCTRWLVLFINKGSTLRRRLLRAVAAAVTFVHVVAATLRLALVAQANSGWSSLFFSVTYVSPWFESSICLQNASDLEHIRRSAAVGAKTAPGDVRGAAPLLLGVPVCTHRNDWNDPLPLHAEARNTQLRVYAQHGE